ncbi:MAG TPA: Crp/Fnr family transcriptional regulator [Gemmatimonadales bacterium]|nr:Crp/Fnr family transcriptional regulator [Gemmatimonadales bacterium]
MAAQRKSKRLESAPAADAAAPAPTGEQRNRILTGLPPEEYARLRPYLTTRFFERSEPLWEPNQPITGAYFPIDAVASVLAVTGDGSAIEVGTIGNEGVVGLPLFLGAATAPGRSLVQIGGEMAAMPAEAFCREAGAGRALDRLLQRYTQGFLTQVSQTTVCNYHHLLPQRLARWVLMVHDRVGRGELELTHEFLGQMLGVRRATVTETLAQLKRQGLIRYRRGVLTVLDRTGLERATCECYRIVRDEFDRLLGTPVG